ncbi:TIGR04222 domain-containing membrane protein [Micromonospora sp. NPDC047812]|uniref:TIGR04222 domain-containing membrane protein n=1 Tax=Micromonospora sp. NPDC047812 TaxID=3155742 RepID=UPI003451A3C7
MTVLAAPGDTWGIPGPAFLGVYLLAAVVIVVGTVVHRLSVLAGPQVGDVGQLGPQQVAYLNGGQQLAIWASLGGLRSSGAIGVRPDRRLTTGGPLPVGITPLDQAVHLAAGRNATTRELARDEWVRRALDQLRTSLEQRGLALAPADRAALRRGAFLLWALLLVGVLRIFAGLGNDRPVGWLVLSQVPLIVVAVLLHRVPWRTRAATRALRDLRRQHTYLAPASAPAYATYGPAGAAMGVALFGTASLYAMDPGFASQAEIQRQAISGSGASSSGGGGSSCSGGSSCGGGGGCGGGGCGG